MVAMQLTDAIVLVTAHRPASAAPRRSASADRVDAALVLVQVP